MKTILIFIAFFAIQTINAQPSTKTDIYRTSITVGSDLYHVYEIDNILFLTKKDIQTDKETALSVFPLHIYYEYVLRKGKEKTPARIDAARFNISNPKLFDSYLELENTDPVATTTLYNKNMK